MSHDNYTTISWSRKDFTVFISLQDKKLLLWLSWSILLVASTGRTNFDWLLQLSDYSQLFDHNSTEWLVKNKAAIAQIPWEILILQFIGKPLWSPNRTEWTPIWSVIIQVINKNGRQRSESPICQSRVWLQTELDDTKSCCQIIITVTISDNLGQTI